MPILKTPFYTKFEEKSLRRWKAVLKKLASNVISDLDLQQKCAAGAKIKQRHLPPFMIGRFYAQYCLLINKIYEAYMENVQLQRDPYFQEIISVVVKRIFELRDELIKIIRNDYLYVDHSLQLLKLTPFDIVVTTPYCMTKYRSEDTEELLQKLWAEETMRRDYKPKVKKIVQKIKRRSARTSQLDYDNNGNKIRDTADDVEVLEEEVEEGLAVEVANQDQLERTESLKHIILLQRHERYRQFLMKDLLKTVRKQRENAEAKPLAAPLEFRSAAAAYVVRVYREYMRLKRKMKTDYRRDVFLGIVPDVIAPKTDIDQINEELFKRKAATRKMIHDAYYVKDEERERTRLMLFRKDGIIDDITDEIVQWFKDWLYDYGFFPSYPYVEEGGTLLCVTGVYPTVDEQQEIDKLNKKEATKTKEQKKADAKKAIETRKLQEKAQKEKKAKEAEQVFKQQQNPKDDPGYTMEMAEVNIVEVCRFPWGTEGKVFQPFIKYRQAWSFFDSLPPAKFKDIVYGYIMPMLTEELKMQLHFECRKYVDELMRLELKVLVKAHKKEYARLEWPYPKFPPRKRPKKEKKPPPPMSIDDAILKKLEPLFDLGVVRKCKTKIKDIWGDMNYMAYECNVKDPDASYPLPGYGDVRRRLYFSCVFGIGVQEGATRRKSVMLLGPQNHGKSFMVDAVAGELNAIKIDVSPEVFSGKTRKAAKMLTVVFAAAKIFQPCVIYCRDVERLFYKKVSKPEKNLKPKSICKALMKNLKKMKVEDKIIFIGTCSNPKLAKKRLPRMFDEIILVPRLDYCSIVQYLDYRFAKIASMPRQFCSSALANVLQGYSFGFVIKLFDEVMTNQRIIDLNLRPLDLQEFQDVVIEKKMMPLTKEEYKFYEEWALKYSPLAKLRAQFAIINEKRAAFFEKERLKKLKEEMKQQAPGN